MPINSKTHVFINDVVLFGVLRGAWLMVVAWKNLGFDGISMMEYSVINRICCNLILPLIIIIFSCNAKSSIFQFSNKVVDELFSFSSLTFFH